MGKGLNKILLALVSSISQNHLVNAVANGTLAAFANSNSPFLAIPLWTIVHILYSLALDKENENEQKEKHMAMLREIRKLYTPQLEKIRNTQITQLEKLLNVDKTIQITQQDIEELKEFVIESISLKEEEFSSLIDKINFSIEEIQKLKLASNNLNTMMQQLSQSVESQTRTIEDIAKGVKYLTKGFQEIHSSQSNSQQVSQVTLDHFCSLKSVPLVQTLFCKAKKDDSLDKGISIIIRLIERGDYREAWQKTATILEDKSLCGSHEIMAWKHALYACIYFYQYDGNAGNEEAKKSIDAFQKSSIETLHPFLALLYAKYYFGSGEIEHAKEILEKSVSEQYTCGAKALLLQISNISLDEAMQELNDDELEDVAINVFLANRALEEKKFDEAIQRAKRAYAQAKSEDIYPPADVYARVLFNTKFPNGTITNGLMRHTLSETEWPEAKLIIELYHECLKSLSIKASPRIKSYFLYYISLVHFICGNKKEALCAAQKFFDLDEVEEQMIELCASIVNFCAGRDLCIRYLGKFKNALPQNALTLYGVLFMEQDSDVLRGIEILQQVIDKSMEPNSLPVFIAAMNIGDYLLQKKETEKFNELTETLQSKQEQLAFWALMVQQYIVDAPDEAKKSLQKLIDFIPADIVSRGKIVDYLMPCFRKLNMLVPLLQLMDDFVPKDEITEPGKHYFNIAMKAKDFQRIKEFGKSLRQAGVFDEEFISAELHYTMGYSPIETEQLANDCLKNKINISLKQIITVYRDLAALSTGTFEKYNHSITDYPPIASITNFKAPYPYLNIPWLLIKSGNVDAGIRYAYCLYLQFPLEQDVRRIFYSLILHSNDATCLNNPNEITNDCAFTYCSITDKTPRTVIVETRCIADSKFKTPDDELVKKLQHATPGYQFSISPWSTQPEYTITEIMNKYVAVAHLLMDDDAVSPNSGIAMIRTPIAANGKADFSSLYKIALQTEKIEQEKIDNATEFYKKHLQSFYFFAYLVRWDILKTIRYFACNNGYHINAAQGDLIEREDAITKLHTTRKILLSPLSLEEIIILKAEHNLDILTALHKGNWEIVLSEYLFEERFATNFRQQSFERLYRDGEDFRISDDEFGKKCHENAINTKKFLSEHATIIPGTLSDSEFTENEDKKMIRKSLYHTIQLAAEHDDFILWDDDATIIPILNKSFNWNVSKRIFSQGVFIKLHQDNLISHDEYANAISFLLSANVYFTSFSDRTICDVFLRLECNQHLSQRIGYYFENCNLEKKSLIKILDCAIVQMLTNYSNLNRAKKGILSLYRISLLQGRLLVENILIRACWNACKIDINKAKPIIKFLRKELTNELSSDSKMRLKHLEWNMR